MTFLYLEPNPYNDLSPHDMFILICTAGVILILFLLRNTPLGFLWKCVKIFFVVLILTLFADKIKNDIKAWWNKD